MRDLLRKYRKDKKLSCHSISVAMNCSVSASTVTKYLTDDPTIKDGSVRRIERWIKENLVDAK